MPQFIAHTNAVFVICIKRPPLLSSGGHPVAVLCLSFFVIFTGIKRAPFNVMETKPYVILYAI